MKEFLIPIIEVICAVIFVAVAYQLLIANNLDSSSSYKSSYYNYKETEQETKDSYNNYKGTGLSEQEMRDLKKGIEDNLGEVMGGQKLEGDLWDDL